MNPFAWYMGKNFSQKSHLNRKCESCTISGGKAVCLLPRRKLKLKWERVKLWGLADKVSDYRNKRRHR